MHFMMFSEGRLCDRICLTQLSRLMWVTFVYVHLYICERLVYLGTSLCPMGLCL